MISGKRGKPGHPRTCLLSSADARNHPKRSQQNLKDGYGFIKFVPDNVFFHFSQLVNVDFRDLNIGDKVTFRIKVHDGKPRAVEVSKVWKQKG
jgi:cold shock CspA family protein